MSEIKKTKRDWVVTVGSYVIAGVVGMLLTLVVIIMARKHENTELRVNRQKLETCRNVLASKDSQVATDLMKLTSQVNAIHKRVTVMVSLLHRDAETINEMKWFVHHSKRAELQGMVGCSYRKNRKGAFRKCKPKFNVADCKKKGNSWVCPFPHLDVVKKRKRKK